MPGVRVEIVKVDLLEGCVIVIAGPHPTARIPHTLHTVARICAVSDDVPETVDFVALELFELLQNRV